MPKTILTYDWIGPEGPWPNGQNLNYLTAPDKYVRSNYAVANRTHPYGLESRRHQFTYPKIHALLNHCETEVLHINDLDGQKAVYEITPLLKPYQWVENVFDHVSDQAKALQRKGQVLFFINDMNEGYSNKKFSLYKKLHEQIVYNELDPGGVAYVSANALETETYRAYCQKNGVTRPMRVREVFLFELAEHNNQPLPKRYHYMCLNRSPAPHRQALVYELWQRDLLKYGLVSMPSPDVKTDYKFHRAHAGAHKLDLTRWDEFIDSLPFVVDTEDFETQDCSSNNLSDFYKSAVLSIVTENTYHFKPSDCIKFTEKTFRPLANYSIPVFVYDENATATLEKMGYELYNMPNEIPAFVSWLEDFVQHPVEEYYWLEHQAERNYERLLKRQKVITKQVMDKLLNGYTV